MAVIEETAEEIVPGTVRLTTAQALVRFLQVQSSVRDAVMRRAIAGVFGIFGHGNVYGIGQALEEVGDALPYYQGKNEQSMVHAAIGFAKASDRLATLACTSSIGPGATNMTTGAATATVNRIPVLLLLGDTFASRRQGPVLQQLEHGLEGDLSVNDCFRPVTRYFDRIQRPEQLLTALPEAMRVLLDPVETGAVALAFHQDAEGEAYDFPAAFLAPRTWQVARRPPAADEIATAVAMLRESSAPVLICGGGVRYSGAEAEARELAESLGIPLVETHAGRGTTVGSDLSLGPVGVLGNPPANDTIRDADLVLVIGSRLTDFITGSRTLFQNRDVRFVGVNVSARDAAKLGAATVVADARLALRALADAVRATGWRAPQAWLESARDRRRRWEADLAACIAPRRGQPMTEGEVLTALLEQTRPDDVVVAGSGTPMVFTHRLWGAADATPFLEFGYSCMGHELPAAIGIRLARADAGEVYAMIGDGTYLMAPGELVTAVQEAAKVTVVVIENGGYQSIRQSQEASTGVSFGNELRHRDVTTGRLTGAPLEIDFAANARSFGCAGFDASTPDELRGALRAARDEARPAVIVAHVDPDSALPASGTWWDVGVAEASRNPVVQETAAVHRRQAALQRYYG
jgi:3D-(3,5/4)-trihydroxycyclohexane-1,2-dione acylhydrolase (decyclizing)